MAVDEEHLRQAALITTNVRSRIGQARFAVAEARKAFSFTRWHWWGDLGQILGKQSPYKSHYNDLKAALEAAEAALCRAESACEALGGTLSQ